MGGTGRGGGAMHCDFAAGLALFSHKVQTRGL